MTEPKTSGLVLWLMSGPEVSQSLSSLISELSEIYQAPTFTPHITLGKVPPLDREELILSLKNLSRDLHPVDVRCFDPICSDRYFQKVTLPIDDKTMVEGFKKTTDNHFAGEYAKSEDYHASLLYGDIPCSDINLNEIRRKTREIHFLHIQSLALIDLNFTPDQWKVIFETKL